MKAAVIDHSGPPEVLQYREVPDPTPRPNEVLVRNLAISIEGGDVSSRAGGRFAKTPHIVGYQSAGEVVWVGPEAGDFQVGDLVVCTGGIGSHAELRAVSGRTAWKLPAGMDLHVASAIPIPFGTADNCLLAYGHLEAGETAFIQSGASGVGMAAIQVAKQAQPDDIVVVLNPDSGRGYLSRVFDDDWMANFGFLLECDECIAAVLDARGDTPSLLYVNPDHTVRDAIEMMRANSISQLPVCKNTPPFANAEVSGAVDELELMEAVYRDPTVMARPVEHVMGPKLPTIGVGQQVATAVAMLDRSPALLVLSGGRPLSVLTRTDLLSYFEELSNG